MRRSAISPWACLFAHNAIIESFTKATLLPKDTSDPLTFICADRLVTATLLTISGKHALAGISTISRRGTIARATL